MTKSTATAAALLALTLAACSSASFEVRVRGEPVAEPPPADTGWSLTTTLQRPGPDAAPDAAPAETTADAGETTEPDAETMGPDSEAPDAAGEASTPDAPADTVPFEAPPPSVEESKCLAGAPRLMWLGAKCRDTLAGFDCAWLRATDGVERCLPPIASVVGYKATTSCLPVDVGYVDATSGSVGSVEVPGSSPPSWSVRYLSGMPKPGAGAWKMWDADAAGVCKTSAVAFPYSTAGGSALHTGGLAAPSSYVAG